MTLNGIVLLVLGWALIEYERGRRELNPLSRVNYAIAVYLFAFLVQYTFGGANTFLLALAGILIWKLRGHGRYFAAFTGQWNPTEDEVGWVDWIVERLMPWGGGGIIPSSQDPTGKLWNYARGTLAMSLQGLYVIALFVLLFGVSLPVIMIGAAVGLCKGVIYGGVRYAPEGIAVPIAEPVWGGTVALALGLVKWWGLP